jgi:hypothetical protein
MLLVSKIPSYLIIKDLLWIIQTLKRQNLLLLMMEMQSKSRILVCKKKVLKKPQGFSLAPKAVQPKKNIPKLSVRKKLNGL